MFNGELIVVIVLVVLVFAIPTRNRRANRRTGVSGTHNVSPTEAALAARPRNRSKRPES